MEQITKLKVTQHRVKIMFSLMALFFLLSGLLLGQFNNIFNFGLDSQQVKILTIGMCAVGVYDLVILLPLHLHILKKREKEILASLDNMEK